jgi:hypothetical protein
MYHDTAEGTSSACSGLTAASLPPSERTTLAQVKEWLIDNWPEAIDAVEVRTAQGRPAHDAPSPAAMTAYDMAAEAAARRLHHDRDRDATATPPPLRKPDRRSIHRHLLVQTNPTNSSQGIAPFRIRLICMGKMLEDDTKSLAAYNVKIFPHPTPINVNVRPADVAQRALSAGKNKTVSGGGAAAQGGECWSWSWGGQGGPRGVFR